MNIEFLIEFVNFILFIIIFGTWLVLFSILKPQHVLSYLVLLPFGILLTYISMVAGDDAVIWHFAILGPIAIIPSVYETIGLIFKYFKNEK